MFDKFESFEKFEEFEKFEKFEKFDKFEKFEKFKSWKVRQNTKHPNHVWKAAKHPNHDMLVAEGRDAHSRQNAPEGSRTLLIKPQKQHFRHAPTQPCK